MEDQRQAQWPAAPALRDALEKSVESAGVFEQWSQAALAGAQCPGEPPQAVQGWTHGDAKRRIQSGEAIGFVCIGTKCFSCGWQSWGRRLGGSNCTAHLNAQRIRHGVLVNDGLAEGEAAKFMTVDELRATGKPLIDVFTGAAMPLPA